jgi:RimJ/RimL family protein N-acetyltransferase
MQELQAMSTPPPKPRVSKFLVGPRVYLKPLERDDLDVFARWANDPISRNLTGDMVPYSRARLEHWYESVLTDQTRLRLVICLAEDDVRIGSIALLGISPIVRSARIDVAIGEKRHWGKGYATESILLVLDHAFGTLALHRVQVDIFGFNTRAIAIYERLGFRREGTIRDGHFFEHRFADVVVMGLLEDEYRERHRSSLA